jgi:hypothetical protein
MKNITNFSLLVLVSLSKFWSVISIRIGSYQIIWFLTYCTDVLGGGEAYLAIFENF